MSFLSGVGSLSPPRAVERMVEQVSMTHPSGSPWTNREKRALMLVLNEKRVSTMLWHQRLLSLGEEPWFQALSSWTSPLGVIKTLKYYGPKAVEAAWLAAPDEVSTEMLLPNVHGNVKQIVLRAMVLEALRSIECQLGAPRAVRTFGGWRRPPRRGQPRHIPDVLGQVLRVVPETEEGLRTLLQNIQNNVRFQPPESHHGFWAELMSTLNEHVGLSDEPWKMRVSAIVRADPSERYVVEDDEAPTT